MDGDVTDAPIEIRRAVASDLDAISSVLSVSVLPLDGVAQSIENFFVADAKEVIVGCVGLEMHGDCALLRSAAVSEHLQGRGIGRRLVNEAIEDAKSRGIRALYLLTTTAENYFPAFGFEKIDRASVPPELNDSPELKGACPASATVMQKRL